MAFTQQTPETLAASGVREDDLAEKRVDREHTDAEEWPQDRLVAVAAKNKRVRFEVRLTYFDALRRGTLGIREQNGCGGYRPNGPTLVFGPEHIDPLLSILGELKAAAIEEGII